MNIEITEQNWNRNKLWSLFFIAVIVHLKNNDLCIVKFTLIFACRKLGMDRVPRVNGEQVDADRLSAVRLFRVHQHSVEESESKNVFHGTHDSTHEKGVRNPGRKGKKFFF